MIEPGPANRYQVDHAERLRRSYHALTGRDLIDDAGQLYGQTATFREWRYWADAAPEPPR